MGVNIEGLCESFVETDGVCHQLGSLLSWVPGLVFINSLHVDVCKKIASLQGYEGERFKVYVNLLVMHSASAKHITALIILAQKGSVKVSRVSSVYVVRELLSEFMDTTAITFSHEKITETKFLGDNGRKLLFKLLVHRFYRLLSWRKSGRRTLIRSWVEITEKMYPQEYPSSLVLIYPFLLNLPRHWNYIKSSFKRYDSVSLYGLPYGLLEWLRVVLRRSDKDAGYVDFECKAYRKHGRELLNFASESMYTSDEFEAAAFVMASEFRGAGRDVINKAHGLSFRCPYVEYNDFTVYNAAQKNYYVRNSKSTSFHVVPRANSGVEDCMSVKGGERVVVYLEANFERLGMVFEAGLEGEVVCELSRLSASKDVRVVVKAHPNRSRSSYKTYAEKTGVEVIRNLVELGDVTPVFVTISSAAYYDFRSYGAFVFVSDGCSDLRDFYGEDLNSYPVNLLGGAIERAFIEGGV